MQSLKGTHHTILFKVILNKVLKNKFKVTKGILFSGSSMNTNRGSKSILSNDKMLLQYGLMSNLQSHFHLRLKH